MYFKDIIGQEDIKKRLLQMVREERIPHALLFTGPEGVGKLALALAFARYLCCSHQGEDDACGHCPSCLQFNKLIHPDMHFVYPIYKPDSKKKWICADFLDKWRSHLLNHPYFSYHDWMNHIGSSNAQGSIYAEESNEILRILNLKSYESVFKIMLVWLPEKMQAACANKLLKMLEEPPENTVFLLISENSADILGTIYSRTQPIVVGKISDEELYKASLADYPQLSTEERAAYIRLAQGSWLKLKRSIESNEDDAYFLQQFIRCMRGAYTIAHFRAERRLDKQKSLQDMKIWAEEMAKIGRERQKQFLAYAQGLVRENYIMNLGVRELTYQTPQEEAFSSKFFPFIHQGNVEEFMQEFELAEKHIEQNVNAKMVFFDLALKCIILFKK